ncbi:uncharacterized protein LOC100645576 isoform X2 [Bombus terrestris]|uniref:Uncharacterized protein LOC100645576 isoform X2 n=1 Tax=Bombus terrestris TaxID=30195 RepID=A0A9B0BLR6_BOMTE|nr:uncharacterized protein LOC100645576 isoform X2 [Bombus terrestris]
MFAKSNVDPELEKLRREVDGPPNLDTVALNIQRATAQIHASYLFEEIGKTTLQKLCLLLSSTATGKIYNGWQEFAAHMGLTMEQIRCIDYDFKGLQDPTYYVLLTYVQHAEATIDKILSILQRMHRFDIINQVKDDVSDLINRISQSTTANESIMRPNNVPRAPLVLTPINFVHNTQRHKSVSGHVIQDNLKKTKKLYVCKVMLTFADDGSETAQHIAKIFRSKEPKIGVLILQEQENYVYSRAEEFIDDCFKQVNFIIPILTQGYMERINNSKKIYTEDQNRLDAKYIKYIYSLLRYEYVRSQCINSRVRCIVPDKEVFKVATTNLHPTLQAWFRESDIDAFVKNILLKKCSK